MLDLKNREREHNIIVHVNYRYKLYIYWPSLELLMQDIASNTAQDILQLEVVHIMLCYIVNILVQMGCIKCILKSAGPRCGQI